MTRKLNPFYELAAQLATEYGNSNSIGMWMKDLSFVKKLGLDTEEVIEAWRALRTNGINGFVVEGATLRTVVTKGSPSYLEQYQKFVLESIPPVWMADEHDAFVRQYAKFLKKRHWRYQWHTEQSQFDGSRISYSEAKELGLAE